MCTVNIKVDDAIMQQINPELTTRESISQWLQSQVNMMIEELATAYHKSPNAHSVEEMHTILADRIRRAESGQEGFTSNQIVFDSIRTKYGF